MRRSPLAILLVVGILLTVGGAVALGVGQNAEVVLAADRAEIPNPLSFSARDSAYRIVLLADPLAAQIPFQNGAEAYFLCSVERADGSSTTIDTANLSSRAETDFGVELGTFDAVAGPTNVTCRWKDDRDSQFYFYSVAPTSRMVSIAATAALIAGLLALTVAVLLIIRARMHAATTRRPLSPEGEAAGPPPGA
ncbi:MAG: hypothetical protein ABIP33_05875 [Pseudolysinimonas sp.]